MTSVLLTLQFSSDTPTRRMRSFENFGRLRLWIWLWEVFRLKCQVWLRVESHWLLLLAKCLDSSGSALRAWKLNREEYSNYLFRLRFRSRVKYPNGPDSGCTQNAPVPAWRLWLLILLEPSFCTTQRACLIRSHRSPPLRSSERSEEFTWLNLPAAFSNSRDTTSQLSSPDVSFSSLSYLSRIPESRSVFH